MTKEDFRDWQAMPITKLFYGACEERIEDAKEVLANSAGLDPMQDSFYRGFIYAYNEMKQFRFEDSEETVH